MRRADLVGKAEPFQRLQSTHADRLIEGVTPVRTGEHVRLRVADQCAVDAGQSFLPDLSTQPLLDRVIVARAQIKIDQLAGALAQAMADIVTRNDQILPAVVLAAQDDVSVGMAGVEMVNRDPVEPGSEIFFHPAHQPTRKWLQILIVRAILSTHDEAELVTVVLGLLEPDFAVHLITVGAVELTAPAVAGRAVPLDIAQMGFGCIEALAQPNRARLDDDTSLPKRCEPIPRQEHAANPGAPSDPAAGEATAAAPYRSAAARQVGGRENTMQKLARPLAAAASPHPAKPGFEIFVIGHDQGSSSEE